MDIALLIGSLAVLAFLVLAVVVGLARRGTFGTPSPAPPPISPAVQGRIQAFLAANPKQRIQAIKMLRDDVPGISLRDAKNAVDWLAKGVPLPGAPYDAPYGAPEGGTADLATRVRELKAAGKTEQAVFLVRGETGMGQEDAEVFVGSL